MDGRVLGIGQVGVVLAHGLPPMGDGWGGWGWGWGGQGEEEIGDDGFLGRGEVAIPCNGDG